MGIICGGGEMITTVKLELGFNSFFIKRFQQKSNELNVSSKTSNETF